MKLYIRPKPNHIRQWCHSRNWVYMKTFETNSPTCQHKHNQTGYKDQTPRRRQVAILKRMPTWLTKISWISPRCPHPTTPIPLIPHFSRENVWFRMYSSLWQKICQKIKDGAYLLVDKRDLNTGLWQVTLTKKVGNQTVNNPETAQVQSDNVHQTTSTLDLMAYLQTSASIPEVSMWIAAVRRGVLKGRPVYITNHIIF